MLRAGNPAVAAPGCDNPLHRTGTVNAALSDSVCSHLRHFESHRNNSNRKNLKKYD